MTSYCQPGRDGRVDEVEDGLKERELNTEGQGREEGRARAREGEREGESEGGREDPLTTGERIKERNT